jgi:hypothetical protein
MSHKKHDERSTCYQGEVRIIGSVRDPNVKLLLFVILIPLSISTFSKNLASSPASRDC